MGDAEGALFRASRVSHNVSRLQGSGVAWTVGTRGVGAGQFNFPVALAADRKGRLFVVDRGNARVQVLDVRDGRLLGTFGSRGEGPGQFLMPRYIAVSGDRVYVSDQLNHRVNVFDLDGKALSSIGTFGVRAGQLNAPRGVAVDSSGTLYVADGGNHRVCTFGADGRFGSVIVDGGLLDSPHGLGVDSAGELWIADGSSGRLFALSTTGLLIRTFEPRLPDGRPAAPHDVAESAGRIFVRALPNAAA